MGSPSARLRRTYVMWFLGLLTVEICIALFVRDRFVRPYLGDVLVVGTVYAFLRILVPRGLPWLPAGVTLLAIGVEVGQYFRLVDRLGLERIPFFRILLGSVFDPRDILCYLVGGALVFFAEWTAGKIHAS